MNRLIYYPTGSYGTFIQWLCNSPAVKDVNDLPFDTDGNSHRYVLSDQYRLLISPQDEQNFITNQSSTVVSCIWPLEHNGKSLNHYCEPNFYHNFTTEHLKIFTQNHVQVLVICPTATSKIWWWHNNCKKVFYTQAMFEKKIKHHYNDVPWLTTTDPIQRSRVQMQYYADRAWYQTLLNYFACVNADQLSLAQLRRVLSLAIHNETFDSLQHWTQLQDDFSHVKFITLDQLRDCTKQTILDIFEYFNVDSRIPLDFVLEQWTHKQTTMHRDQQHCKIINCVVNQQDCDWAHMNFDLFDEVYLLLELRHSHKIELDVDHIDCLPTNTADLLALAR